MILGATFAHTEFWAMPLRLMLSARKKKPHGLQEVYSHSVGGARRRAENRRRRRLVGYTGEVSRNIIYTQISGWQKPDMSAANLGYLTVWFVGIIIGILRGTVSLVGIESKSDGELPMSKEDALMI